MFFYTREELTVGHQITRRQVKCCVESTAIYCNYKVH